MIFTADVSNGISVRFTGDVIKTAKIISLGMPTESVIIHALGQVRMAFLGGEMVTDEPNLSDIDFDMSRYPAEIHLTIQSHWKNLLVVPLYCPMTLLERFRLGRQLMVIDSNDHTTEKDLESFDPKVYAQYLDSLHIRKFIEI